MSGPQGTAGRAVRWLLGLSIVVFLATCTREEPVTVAGHVWVGYEPMYMARAMGWLDPQRVSLLETANSGESLAALRSGRVDGAALTLDEVLQARGQGLDLRVVLVFNLSVGADVLLVRPPITELAELRSRRVGFEHGAVGQLLVSKALDKVGLSLADIEAVDLTMNAQLAAWEAGLVDAVASYEPTASRLRAAGALAIFDSSEIPMAILDVLAFRADRLNARTDTAVRHLIAAHFRALSHLNDNPEDAAFRMAVRLGLPPDRVLPAFRGLVLPDVTNNYRLLQGAQAPLLESSRELVEFKLATGMLSVPQSLDDLIEADYLPVLVRQVRP